jgi:hypothetical protein
MNSSGKGGDRAYHQEETLCVPCVHGQATAPRTIAQRKGVPPRAPLVASAPDLVTVRARRYACGYVADLRRGLRELVVNRRLPADCSVILPRASTIPLSDILTHRRMIWRRRFLNIVVGPIRRPVISSGAFWNRHWPPLHHWIRLRHRTASPPAQAPPSEPSAPMISGGDWHVHPSFAHEPGAGLHCTCRSRARTS